MVRKLMYPLGLCIVLAFLYYWVFISNYRGDVALKTDVELSWEKHTIMEKGGNYTVVALDVNGDNLLDVISSYRAKVSLFIAPDWHEVVIHDFGKLKGMQGAIGSGLIDVDNDGDLDWLGALAHGHPFWLENPGDVKYGGDVAAHAWQLRMIDSELTAIHCLEVADIDNDGRDDVVINNFHPEDGLADSIAWFSIPQKPREAVAWNRYIFADRDARGGSHYMGVGDVDGDGWKEIAVGVKGAPFADGNWFGYWQNPGGKQVAGEWEKVMLADNQVGATNILPMDVNGDGKLDWIATRGHGVGVLWFENPSWKIHEIDLRVKSPHSLTIADFDQDGDPDAAICGYESKWVGWYQNDGKGNFTTHQIDQGQESYDLRSYDMDGDGDMDLLNAGRASKNIVWYENLLIP